MPVSLAYDPLCLQHDTGVHPESSKRLLAVLEHLRETGLNERLALLPCRDATEDELLACHDGALIRRIRRLSARGGGHLDIDTIVGPGSYGAAVRAAGCVLAATEAIVAGAVDRAYCLVRPPGHHATRHRAMGFCLLNNSAIAARRALDALDVARLAIVDFDVHHGNGTADILGGDRRVLYVSLHQEPLFPETGGLEASRSVDASPHTVNIPLPPRTGDRGYALALERVVAPAVRRFRPELLLVSAGYDGHWADPLAHMLLTLQGYYAMVQSLVALADELCHGRILLALEGGYHLEALARGVEGSLLALLGLPADDPMGSSSEAERDVSALIDRIARHHGLA